MNIGRGRSPALASDGTAIFLVWEEDGTIVGTPMRNDGDPHVPGGFAILPSYTQPQTDPAIAAVDDGFLLLWVQEGLQSVVISRQGVPHSSSAILGQSIPRSRPVLASSSRSALVAWDAHPDPTLFVHAGVRPFESFPVGDLRGWTPVQIREAGTDRYLLVYLLGGQTYARLVQMDGGYVTSIAGGEVISRRPVGREGVALIAGQLVAVWRDAERIVAGVAEPGRRRGASRELR